MSLHALWLMIILGFIYSLMVNANINGVPHNFIHNPFFRAPLLNRLFGVTESIACCFSQTYYDVVHMRHHKGNSDRKDENGETIEWLSIYRHGDDDEPENPWSYVFLSFFPRQSGGDPTGVEEARRDGSSLGQHRAGCFRTDPPGDVFL